eukprot:6853803-Pyramimonas_sp.AAC.1
MNLPAHETLNSATMAGRATSATPWLAAAEADTRECPLDLSPSLKVQRLEVDQAASECLPTSQQPLHREPIGPCRPEPRVEVAR